jgi:predicted phage terminase large subunit-like protein
VILASYEAGIAAYWGRSVRDEIMNNPLIGVKIRPDIMAADDWQTIEGGGMKTAGIGGALTGRGSSVLLLDDPVKNWLDATSYTIRERNKNWVRSTWMTRAEPGALKIVIQTRWHEDDVAGWLLREHRDEWTEIWLPAIAETSGDILGRSEGEALCPQRYDRKALVGVDGEGGIKKSVGPIVWNGLYRQRPSSLEGGVIKRAWFRTWQTIPENATYGISVDCAFEKTDDTSFVVVACWAKHGPNRYLVDQERERMDFVETCEAIKRMSDKWPQALFKLVEAKANGPAVISAMKDKIPGLHRFNPRGSKLARLTSVSPLFSGGNVFLPDDVEYPWVKDYKEELVNFPNAPTDDQVDCTSQILIHWSGLASAAAVAPGSVTRVSPIPS